MSFILRIFFSGLIAFVPGAKGKELTILLLNTPHSYHTSDGAPMAHHRPLLLARAASCSGTCPRDADVAQFLFADAPPSQASAAMNGALDGGAAWQLSGSDISFGPAARVRTPLLLRRDPGAAVIPHTPQEREGFEWVADFTKIDPAAGGLNPAMLKNPPPGLIAGRIHLRNGEVTTYRLVEVDGKVQPIHFKPLQQGAEVPYSQAVASWVMAEVEVSGDSIDIVDSGLGRGGARTMKLTPRDGVVELAVLNLPPFEPLAPGQLAAGQPGKHFEIYYELAKTPPAKGARPIPQAGTRAGDPQADGSDLHVQKRPSDLLERLRFGERGPYDQTLCPMIHF
jgi:hypothetical protein